MFSLFDFLIEHYFLVERLFGLFWVMVQQFCFACLKYTHDSIIGAGMGIGLLLSQFLAFALLTALCFEQELGINFLSKALLVGGKDYYP